MFYVWFSVWFSIIELLATHTIFASSNLLETEYIALYSTWC